MIARIAALLFGLSASGAEGYGYWSDGKSIAVGSSTSNRAARWVHRVKMVAMSVAALLALPYAILETFAKFNFWSLHDGMIRLILLEPKNPIEATICGALFIGAAFQIIEIAQRIRRAAVSIWHHAGEIAAAVRDIVTTQKRAEKHEAEIIALRSQVKERDAQIKRLTRKVSERSNGKPRRRSVAKNQKLRHVSARGTRKLSKAN